MRFPGNVKVDHPNVRYVDISGITFIVANGVNAYNPGHADHPFYSPSSAYWDIHFVEDGVASSDVTCLVIDQFYDDAFFHWVFESAIFLPYMSEINKIYPSTQVICSRKKDFKTLFYNYFSINLINYETSANPSYTYIFPMLINNQNDNYMSEDYKLLINRFFKLFECPKQSIEHEYLILPRQTKENYANNNRQAPLHSLLENFQKYDHDVLHTDIVSDLSTQISKVRSANTVIVVDGSAFLVNGVFMNGQNIVVLSIGVSTKEQSDEWSKMRYIIDMIKHKNTVTYYPSEIAYLETLPKDHVC